MSFVAPFSETYDVARRRFREASQAANCHISKYLFLGVGPSGEELSMDVSFFRGITDERVLVLSSGLHGIEGFLGSAIQSEFIERYIRDRKLYSNASIVFIHALNPYGFAWRRRCDENNVDLNRNFILPSEYFEGSPKRYPELNAFFNPKKQISRLEPFSLKLLIHFLLHGQESVRRALPFGQYDFPKGLFFGGAAPSQTQEILSCHLSKWLKNSSKVLHLDFHTGLGSRFSYQLLTEESYTSDRCLHLRNSFGSANVSSLLSGSTTTYSNKGSLGKWCKHNFKDRTYDLLYAEFGTMPMFSVLKALRAENSAYFYGKRDSLSYSWARNLLFEAFNPSDIKWQRNAASLGIELIQRALKNLNL